MNLKKNDYIQYTKPNLPFMSTYTQILYQIVFSTKNRIPTLTKNNRDQLFKYIAGVIKNKNCQPLQINGVEDHIHILTHLHPSIALSDLIKDIKLASTSYIKEEKLFPNFNGWQNGYGAFTYSVKELDVLVRYVQNQEEHHQKKTFQYEYIKILERHSINYDERYL